MWGLPLRLLPWTQLTLVSILLAVSFPSLQVPSTLSRNPCALLIHAV